jgi:hypothetical protein
MKLMKIINKYLFPIIIFILLLAFFIWAVTSEKEGFKNGCKCDDGSELKNGGCYSCEPGYKLSTDYYNVKCISENPNDHNTPKHIKGAKKNSIICT